MPPSRGSGTWTTTASGGPRPASADRDQAARDARRLDERADGETSAQGEDARFARVEDADPSGAGLGEGAARAIPVPGTSALGEPRARGDGAREGVRRGGGRRRGGALRG